jgi:hypothetical protein
VAGAVFTANAHGQQAPPGPPAAPTGTGMIAGRVVDSESGQGVAGATVSLRLFRPGAVSEGQALAVFPTVLTDSQGRFVFPMLPAGGFMGTASRDNYSGIQMRSLDLSSGERMLDFNFRLEKLHAVLGTVRDDVGDPVVGTDVIAFVRSAPQGRPASFVQRARGRTDDRGEYRLVSLPAGQYVICACSRDVIPFDGHLLSTLASRPLDLLTVARRAATAGSGAASLDSTLRTYAPTFHPNSPLASQAERVKLEKGETRMSVDITVAPVRAVRVSGQIVGLPPSSISAGSMRLTAVGDLPEARAITQIPPMLVQPDGRFDFAGVPPGTYILDVHALAGTGAGSPTGGALAFVGARGGPPPPPPAPGGGRGRGTAAQDVLWATETVVVGDEDVVGLVVPIQRGVSVRGKVEFVGSAGPPAALRGGFQLAAMETRPMRPVIYPAQLNPDGTFVIALPPGRYVIPATPQFAAPWTNVRSITVKGVDILDAPLMIDGDILDMVVSMTDTPSSSLLVTAELPAGELPEEWAVLIFPSDRRLWTEPFGAVRRFVTLRFFGPPTFTQRLPPGDYFLTLVRSVPQDWIEASTLEGLAKGATSISLAEGEQKPVQVKR